MEIQLKIEMKYNSKFIKIEKKNKQSYLITLKFSVICLKLSIKSLNFIQVFASLANVNVAQRHGTLYLSSDFLLYYRYYYQYLSD
jgi:hypothetical protein